MKYKLFCSSIAIFIGVLNGSVIENEPGIDLESELLSNLEIPKHGQPYGTPGLATAYGANAGFSKHSFPYWASYGTSYEPPCRYQVTNDVLDDFRTVIYGFISHMYRKASELGELHLVFSPCTTWLSMAALAEGAQGAARKELFRVLNLPEDQCLRRLYYQLATTREKPSDDVVLDRKRFFITDTSVHVNRNWKNLAHTQTDLNTVYIPFKSSPFGELQFLKKVFNAQLPNINLSGNSFLLESLDYHGLWKTAFSDAVIETGPFYNVAGEQIGTMEYMKMRKRVRVAYAPTANMKVIEIPVGNDGRYNMLFGIILDKEDYERSIKSLKDSIMYEIISNFRQTSLPMDVMIPRLKMKSEVDMRKILEDIGIKSIWADPSATRNISNPAALPSSYIQRVTITVDNSSVQPSIQEYSSFVPQLKEFEPGADLPDSELTDFIANKPFLFGLFDSELYICLFSASFSKPYSN